MRRHMPTSYPKVSNRERQRLAAAAIRLGAEQTKLLCAVLAQKGGEVIVTRGTLLQVTDDMSVEIVPNPANPETEVIVRILKGTGE